MAKKVFIKTLGCQMNDRDSEALTGLFLDKGYELAERAEEADVVLVNTCSVREHAENRAISFLGALKKTAYNGQRIADRQKRNKNTNGKSPRAKSQELRAGRVVGLIGCMARNRGEEIFNKMFHVNLVCGPGCVDKIPEYVERIKEKGVRIKDVEDRGRDESFYLGFYRCEPDYAQVVISTGCSNFCSYCVVPFVRGKLRFRSPEAVVDEVKRNVERGYRKITLLGQNVNDYQFVQNSKFEIQNSKFTFLELLRMVEKIDGVEELTFITSHPKNTSKELFDFMAQSRKIRKQLHLPFQSGSNRILELMNRGYTREKYLELVEYYKKKVGGSLGTDVIVGFPTETEEDFLGTKDILERVKFNYAYIFKYSPRPRTKAAELEDDVTEDAKKKRHKILLDLQKKTSLAKDKVLRLGSTSLTTGRSGQG